jgi:hypothetical protein
MTTDTEVNPFIHRWFTGLSESFSTWACLLWAREEWGDPGDRTDGHAGRTANTNISITVGPNCFFHNHDVNLISLLSKIDFSPQSHRGHREIFFDLAGDTAK